MRSVPARALLGVLTFVGACSGQTAKESKLTIPVTTGETGQGCPAGVNFETAGYLVTSSKIYNPFDFLPWIRAKDEAAQESISKLVDGLPFLFRPAVTESLDIINQQDFFPSAPLVKIRVRVELVVVHCSGKNLS